MTMTREEARQVLRDYVLSAYVTDAEREAIRQAIAALSAQEPFGFIEPETGNFCWLEDAKRCPKDAATYTLACYAAPPAQAEPLRVAREAIVLAAAAMEYERVCGHSPLDALMAALHQLGAKVEVSDG